MTLPSPGRWPAATPVPWPQHLRQLSDQTPDVRPTYVALARATAERALASGRLSASAAEPLLDILAAPKEPS